MTRPSCPTYTRPSSGGKKRPLLQRLGNISETGLHDFKEIMVFLMLGLARVGSRTSGFPRAR